MAFQDRATEGIDPARFHHIDDVTMITPVRSGFYYY